MRASFNFLRPEINHFTLFIAALLVFSLSSCNQAFYTPNEAYLHGLDEKGEIKIAGTIPNPNRNATYRQYNAVAAYSPIKNVGVIGSFQQVGSGNDRGPLVNWRIRTMEGALGYYYKKPMRYNPNQYILYDAYLGYGAGTTKYTYNDLGTLDLSYDRFFVTAGVHVWLSRSFGVSFGLRVARLNFQEAKLFGVVSEEERETISLVQQNNPFTTIEPSLQYTYGVPAFKVFFSLTGISGAGVRFSNTFAPNTPIGQPLAKLGVIIDPTGFKAKKKGKESENDLGFLF